MKTKEGKKLIDIFRVLADQLATNKEIKSVTRFSRSEVRKLLILAEKHELVSAYSMTDIGKPRGRPRDAKEKTWTGRYPNVYSLTWKSRFLMRLDSKLVDDWKSVEKTQYELEGPNMLDSFNNLRHAIKTHPVLNKFERPYYFDGILQRTLLNPFLFKEFSDEGEFNHICN